MNQYCLWKSRYISTRSKIKSHWYYICKINVKMSKSGSVPHKTITIKVKETNHKYSAAIESGQATVDLTNWHYNKDDKNLNPSHTDHESAISDNWIRCLLVNYHPLLDLLLKKRQSKSKFRSNWHRG